MPKIKPTSKLRIGFVLDDSLDERDGVQQYMLTVGEWMRSQGHEVHYLVSNSTTTDIVNVHSLGRNMSAKFNGNRMNTPLLAPKNPIVKLLKELDLDVLHVQVPYSPLLAGRIIKAASAKTAVIGTFHILPESKLASVASRLLAIACRNTLRRFDNVVSVSPAASKFARGTFHISSTVVPNVINLKKFSTAKPLPGTTKEPLNILFLGRLVPRKGCMYLLRAVNILQQDKTLPPFKVTICGKGPLLSELKDFVTVNGLDKIVNFEGFVSEADKPRHYASADIAVFPSTGGESFGIVLAEAMASGRTAVLAGNNPGYSSVLESCPENVLFDPKDTVALATRIRTLLLDDKLRSRIAHWQYQYAKNFDIGHVGPKLLHTYESVLSGRRSMP